MSKRLIMMQAVTLVALCSVGTSSLLAITAKKASRKSYTRELEEAFAAKILQDKDEPVSVFKSGKNGEGASGHKEVGSAVVTDIKTMLKNPFLDLLASSDLASWSDVKGRFEAVKRALELFEVKHTGELKGSASTSAPSTSVGMPSGDMGMASASSPMGAPSITPPPAPTNSAPMSMGMMSTPTPPAPPAPAAPTSMGMPSGDMGMSSAPSPMSAPSVTPPPTLPAPAPMGMPSATPEPSASPAIPSPMGIPGGDMGMSSAPSPMGAPGVTPPPTLPAPAPMGMPSATPAPAPVLPMPSLPAPTGAPSVTPPPMLPAPAPMGMPSTTPAPMGMPMA